MGLEGRREAVERMSLAMVHRGPDDAGAEDFGDACLGMRRLSIIDCSPQGHQPMSNEDGSVWVVLNGEIYNFKELRSDLEQKGHTFRSRTDTETIVHLYEAFGEGFLDHLRGMFSLAVWDGRRGRLLVARDRVGIKPLYYAEIPSGWVFASELGALLSSRLLPRELDVAALDLYLSFGYVPPPGTLIKGIRVLLPGHCMVISKEGMTSRQWWDFPVPGSNPCPPGKTVPWLRSILDESIRLHQISDVPLGAFLSGGMDSTAVVGLMSRISSEPVRTFSIGFDDAPAGFDERPYARMAAEAYGSDHTEVVMNGATVREALPRIVRHIDIPSFDGINTFLVSQAAREGGLTVALSGLGGDEVFGGYDTFHLIPRWGWAARLWGKGPRWTKAALSRVVKRLSAESPSFTSERSRKVNRMMGVNSETDLYALARLILWPDEVKSLYSDSVRMSLPEDSGPMALLRSLSPENGNSWHRVNLLEMQVYMGWRLLRDTDAMSMAHSLEVRVPLIDHKVIEFVAGLPEGWEKTWGHPKRLLSEALGDLIPPEILSRPKQGFAFPMGKWMRGELREVVEDTLSPESVRRRGLFDPEGVQSLYRAFEEGRMAYPALWQFVILELWMRETFDAPVAVSQAS